MDYKRYTTLKVDKKDRIATVTLNRPQALNAIDATMHHELEDIWVDLMADDEVYVAILTGTGRCFSAGGDLKGMVETLETGKQYTDLHGARRLIMNVLSMEKPVVAALNGDAIGLAANIALFSDIIICADDAKLGDPHVRIGMVAGDSGAIVWPLLAGMSKAKELLLTGDLIDAKKAEGLGIVNHVVPRDQVMPMAMGFAKRLAFGPTRAIRWTKICINKRLRDEVNLVLDASLGIEFTATFGKEDHREGTKAFVEKREPKWPGLWP